MKTQCDGETFLGFTTKHCDHEATSLGVGFGNERYNFCAQHLHFWRHGKYPDPEPTFAIPEPPLDDEDTRKLAF